jgi:phage-related baseplate assembly protein
MTRFVSPDLSGLAPPPAVESLDFESILAARKADLATRATGAGLTDLPEVLALESEPLSILEQTDAYFELLIRQRINDAVRACLIATATGASLDHLIATFYGVERLLITPADNTTIPPTPAVYEDDDTYRARGLLSMEARSTAGPAGAYIYFALQADPDVLDAACYSEDDAAKYANGVFVKAPEVLVVVLSRVGSGVPSSDLINTVTAALNAEDVRPIGDKVTVERATVINYSVQGVLKYAPGADATAMVAEATARVQAYADARHRIGKIVQRFGLAAGLKVTDAEEVELTVLDNNGNPTTSDIDPGSKGAAYCTSITITAQVESDSWRP